MIMFVLKLLNEELIFPSSLLNLVLSSHNLPPWRDGKETTSTLLDKGWNMVNSRHKYIWLLGLGRLISDKDLRSEGDAWASYFAEIIWGPKDSRSALCHRHLLRIDQTILTPLTLQMPPTPDNSRPSGPLWDPLCPSGPVWTHMDPYRPLWRPMDRSGPFQYLSYHSGSFRIFGTLQNCARP